MPNYIAGNGITIENNIISSKTTSTSEIGSFKVDGSTIYIDNNNVIHGKKEQKITLSDYTLEIGTEATTVTVLSHKGDGALSVSSSDTSVATASISGDTITIIGVDSGDAIVTVSAAATSQYQAGSATIAVTATVIKIYGAEWDGSSSPAWTRTDAAVSFTDPNPYYSGMSDTPSSPFDNIMPWSGMRIVEDSNAGTLVEIPKFYYKWIRNGAAMKLQICMAQEEGFLCSPAHADRGDGVGERDYVYIGRYSCSTAYKSETNENVNTSMRRSNFRSNIHNLGTNIWQNDFAIRWTINMLYLVEFAHWNSQRKIGYGCGGTQYKTGMTDSMGYHTGTTNSSRAGNAGVTQYRFIEALWGNASNWVDGIRFDRTNVYIIKNPQDFSDSSGGILMSSSRANASGYIIEFAAPTNSGFEYALYPSYPNGTSSDPNLNGTSYICDYYYYGSSNTILAMGGDYSPNQEIGLFEMIDKQASYTGYDIGSRLMVLPPSRLTSTT